MDSLVLLRGIAVAMVCFCHFGFPLSGDESAVLKLFSFFHNYGKYGVHIFFVISGFIIPYSLFRGKYQIKDYPLFLYKRLLRLQPPYLAALTLTLVVMYFSYKVRHVAFPENIGSILLCIPYFHFPSDNPVFWTLAVEAEYYLFIGLFFTLLTNHHKITNFIIIPILLIATQSFLSTYVTLLPYLVFFLVGNIGFLIYTNTGDNRINIFILGCLFVFIAFFYPKSVLCTSLFTLLFILLYKKKVPEILKFVGVISYSLYLIHFPLGIKIINLVKPKISPSHYWILFIATLAIIIALAYGFYKVFEEFSERISKRIKYSASAGVK